MTDPLLQNIYSAYMPQIHPPNCPFPFNDHHQNPYRARPHSPPQTASRSNQPCCHCSHVWTDTWDGRMFSTMSTLLAILIESDALIIAASLCWSQYMSNMI